MFYQPESLKVSTLEGGFFKRNFSREAGYIDKWDIKKLHHSERIQNFRKVLN